MVGQGPEGTVAPYMDEWMDGHAWYKDKFVPVLDTQTNRGRRGIAPFILKLEARRDKWACTVCCNCMSLCRSIRRCMV